MHQLLRKEEHHLDSHTVHIKLKAQLVSVVQVGRENCMICLSMQKPQPTTMYQGVGKFVNNVVIKDVPINLRKGEYVVDMVQRSNDAVMKDVTVMRRKEESVRTRHGANVVQQSNLAMMVCDSSQTSLI